MNRQPPGVVASKNMGSLYLADTVGRLFENHFGVDAPSSLKNWDDGATLAALTGAGHAYTPGSISVSGNAATPRGVTFNEGAPVNADMTLVWAGAKPSASQQMFYSSGLDALGQTLAFGLSCTATLISGRNSAVGGGGLASLNWPTMTTEDIIIFMWGRFGDFPRVQYFAGGVLSAVATGTNSPPSTGRALPAGAPLQLAINGGGSGNGTVSFASALAEAKSEAWRLETAIRTKKQLQARGRTVL